MRHVYRIELFCLRCDASGIADVAQIDDEYTNFLDFNVDHVTKGFYVSRLTNSPATTEVRCSRCGAVITTTGSGTRVLEIGIGRER